MIVAIMAGMDRPNHPVSQFALLRQRRFAPFFATQFLGAANDNLLKFALTVMVTYQLHLSWLSPAMAGLVIGALFILPLLLFSATSGQLTDKYPKDSIIRLVKTLEVGIMALALVGFLLTHVPLLLLCVFLMGVHSTLFGPVKYALLPQVLHEGELTGGNGMVEMGTFVAILLGNLLGGALIALPQIGATAVAIACMVLAILGWLAARQVPPIAAAVPDLRINWNLFTESWRNVQLARQYPVVFRALIGINWMWFVGAALLAQFPVLAKDVLHGNEHVASLLLVVFSVGIGIGSLLCEKLSRGHINMLLVPLGALGMVVFLVDLYWALSALAPRTELAGLSTFLQIPGHSRVLLDLGALALSAGIYSVPLYALVQWRSPATHRARIIATNNILGALFMIASSLIVSALLGAGLTLPMIFALLGVSTLFFVWQTAQLWRRERNVAHNG